jgi:glycosyltransferase involved in cell wall biosynthesis
MLLINLVPVSSGGGLQNSVSFLSLLATYRPSNFQYIVACVQGGPVHKACRKMHLPHYAIWPGRLGRLWYEFCSGYVLLRKLGVSVVFTLFGAAPIVSPRVHKISGFAYSNIIQSEIPFWSFLPVFHRLWKLFTDQIRLLQARRADEIILETEFLAARAVAGIFKDKIVRVVEMAPSVCVLNTINLTGERTLGHPIEILYLTGAHPNKRIHLLADVFAALNNCGHRYRLVTTLKESAPYYKVVKESFERAGASHALRNIGSVRPEAVGHLLSEVDALVNVALLESFSNNWVESWAACLPLIVTDAEWARFSCGDAAIYVDPSRPSDAAIQIARIFDSAEALSALRQAGKRKLAMLPSPKQRFDRYLEIISTALDRYGEGR